MVAAVGERLVDLAMPKIVDPVLVSKHGHSLADDDVVEAMLEHLIPQAYVLTPNRFEAERLTGLKLDSEDRVAEAIYRLQECGAQHVLIKLGEVDGQSQHVMNYGDGNTCFIIPRIADAKNTHGTGCILSAALTARLALGEQDLRAAVNFAIEQVYQAIHCNTELGQGYHPAEIRAMGQ
jgi:hydroxymethylpyrimidine/phosphomethylpyrimidine kinase